MRWIRPGWAACLLLTMLLIAVATPTAAAAATGTITGTITVDGNPVRTNVDIMDAVTGDWVASDRSNKSGLYEAEVPPGEYRIRFDGERSFEPDDTGFGWLEEWYSGAADEDSATVVAVEGGGTVTADADLTPGAVLEIRVVDAISTQPIASADVTVAWPIPGSDTEWTADANGAFRQSGIGEDAGRVLVGAAGYRYEWYDEGDADNRATPISRESGIVPAIPIPHDKGTGSIAGVVRDENTGLPVVGTRVIIEDYVGTELPESRSGRFFVSSAVTDENGRYQIDRLRSHDYVILVSGDADDHLYKDEYYLDAASAESATTVQATVGEVAMAGDVLLDYVRCDGKIATIWRTLERPWGARRFAGTDGDDVIIAPDRRGSGGREPFYWDGITYYAQAGDDTICASNGDDHIYGGAGNDTIFAKGGGDWIRGGGGRDTIYGGAGDDTIDGENGADTIQGGSGNDTINGGPKGDVIRGGAGTDDILGYNGDDVLRGGPGDGDMIGGGRGDDRVYGGTGSDDWCKGGAGGNDRARPSCELATGIE